LGISGRGAKGAIGLAARGNHLEFSLPRKARVAVEILSADGKRVRAFPGREYGAGAHRLAWDGRDASGHAVAPGTYLARLRAGNAEKSAQWRWEGP
jgi:flagellar hook assembly protein FlgD